MTLSIGCFNWLSFRLMTTNQLLFAVPSDQSIIDLTNETQEEVQNDTQDDIEFVGQNIKCTNNDEPIYCNQPARSQLTSQMTSRNKRRRTSSQTPDEDVLEIHSDGEIAPPPQRARLAVGETRRNRHSRRTCVLSLRSFCVLKSRAPLFIDRT